VLLFACALTYRAWSIGCAAVLLGALVTVASVSGWIARNGSVRAASQLFTLATLLFALATVLLAPFAMLALAAFCVVAAVRTLRVVSGARLAMVLIASSVVACAVILIGTYLPRPLPVPLWLARAIAASAGVIAVGFMCFQMYQLTDWLRSSLARIATQEQRFRSVVRATAQNVWSAARDGSVTQGASSAEPGAAAAPPELLGWGWLELVHADQRDRVQREWREAIEQTSVFETEYRLRAARGRYRWTLVRAAPVFDDGQVVGWVGTASDIDARKQDELRATVLRQVDRKVLEGRPTDELLQLFCNQLVQAFDHPLVWVSAEQPEGRLAVRALAGPMRTRLEAVSRDLESGLEHPALTALKSRRPQVPSLEVYGLSSALSLPLVAHDSTLGALVVVSRAPDAFDDDETLRELEELASAAALAIRAGLDNAQVASLAAENARLYREAQEAVKVRDAFLSIASHELKVPLTPLYLLSQSLRATDADRHLPQGVASKLERMNRQVERLVRLVNDLLDVSRLQSGQLKLEISDVDLGQLTREVVTRFADQAARAHCELSWHCPSVYVSTDPLRFEEVISNLVENALKYGKGHPVELELSELGDWVQLTVRDHGIGISREDQERIFERFERAAPGHEGTGLGLWIVRQILDGLGGSITVESTLGQGSTFTVSLPRHAPSAFAPFAASQLT
jgi:PAS domain S-box-containing protein